MLVCMFWYILIFRSMLDFASKEILQCIPKLKRRSLVEMPLCFAYLKYEIVSLYSHAQVQNAYAVLFCYSAWLFVFELRGIWHMSQQLSIARNAQVFVFYPVQKRKLAHNLCEVQTRNKIWNSMSIRHKNYRK